MNFMDMDFSDINLENMSVDESQEQESKNKLANDIVRRHMAALKDELYKNGASIKTEAAANNVRVNSISQELYIARMHVLRKLIKEPKLTDCRTIVSKTWKELYPHFEYGNWVTKQDLGKRDKATVRELLKEEGIRKGGTLQTVGDLVRILITHAAELRLQEAEQLLVEKDERIRTLELKLEKDLEGNTSTIWYRGVEIRRLKRVFKAKVGEVELTNRHGVLDGMVSFLDNIDKLLN